MCRSGCCETIAEIFVMCAEMCFIDYGNGFVVICVVGGCVCLVEGWWCGVVCGIFLCFVFGNSVNFWYVSRVDNRHRNNINS